jgi:hypothetical protein
VVGADSLFHQAKVLRRQDVEVDSKHYCLWISVRFTKTLQYQDRVHRVAVAGMPGAALDPVQI